MRTRIKLAGIVFLFICLLGCTDAQMANINSYGQKHRIKQFSGGQLIGEWVSTGRVQNEDKSDGFLFEDEKTRKLVEVSGTVQITIE